MMHDVLVSSLGTMVALFVFTSMFCVGLDLTVRQIVEPLRDRPMLARSLGTNIVLVPLLALTLTLFIPLDDATRIGLLLYACCAGSEAAPKFVQIAKGNAAFAVALLGILLALTVGGVPLVVDQISHDAHVDQGKLVLKLLVIVALPLGLGLLIKARRDAGAVRLSAVMHPVSSLFLFVVLLQIIYVNFEKFAALQSSTVLAGLLFFPVASAMGYLMGGPGGENRRALLLMTGIRGGSISMVIAGQAFPHSPDVLVMATVMTALSVVIFVPASILLGRIVR